LLGRDVDASEPGVEPVDVDATVFRVLALIYWILARNDSAFPSRAEKAYAAFAARTSPDDPNLSAVRSFLATPSR
jgi:hypothetical protein